MADFISSQVETLQALKSMADGSGSVSIQSMVDAFARQIVADTGGNPDEVIPLSREMRKQKQENHRMAMELARFEQDQAHRARMNAIAEETAQSELIKSNMLSQP